jgi:hypothetical protein
VTWNLPRFRKVEYLGIVRSECVYLVRHGAMGAIEPGRSVLDRLERGEKVVVSTRRGQELGEILGPVRTLVPQAAQIVIERPANSDDLHAAAEAIQTTASWLTRCQTIFGEGHWPIEILDVEPLLDPGRAVIYYLGPHPLDTDGLCSLVRERYGHELVFEAVMIAGQTAESSCGSGGCGSCGEKGGEGGGGCGTSAGCSSCGIARSMRPAPARP